MNELGEKKAARVAEAASKKAAFKDEDKMLQEYKKEKRVEACG